MPQIQFSLIKKRLDVQNIRYNPPSTSDNIYFLCYPRPLLPLHPPQSGGRMGITRNCLYEFVRYLEPRYLKLSLCLTIFLVLSVLFRAVFLALSQTFSFHSFKCWKNRFENFERMFIFFYFNTRTGRSSESLTSKVRARNVRL